MFKFSTWIVDNLISGVKNGIFDREWAAVQLANYYVKDKVTEADIVRFDTATATEPTEESAEMEDVES